MPVTIAIFARKDITIFPTAYVSEFLESYFEVSRMKEDLEDNVDHYNFSLRLQSFGRPEQYLRCGIR